MVSDIYELMASIKSDTTIQTFELNASQCLGHDFKNKINEPGRCGWTLLGSAASEGNLTLVKFFLQLGAQIELGCDKASPLMIATMYDQDEIVTYLVEQGANIHTTLKDSYSGLRSSHIMMRSIYQKGANLLDVAAENDNIFLGRFLIKKKLNPDNIFPYTQTFIEKIKKIENEIKQEINRERQTFLLGLRCDKNSHLGKLNSFFPREIVKYIFDYIDMDSRIKNKLPSLPKEIHLLECTIENLVGQTKAKQCAYELVKQLKQHYPSASTLAKKNLLEIANLTDVFLKRPRMICHWADYKRLSKTILDENHQQLANLTSFSFFKFLRKPTWQEEISSLMESFLHIIQQSGYNYLYAI